MAIHRISFPEGREVPSRQPINAYIAGIVLTRANVNIEQLDPGEYDLTPAAWETNIYTHELLVHSDDRATYKATPNFPDAATEVFGPTAERQEPIKKGGRSVLIPEDIGMAVIGCPTADGSGVEVYEVICHVPSQ